MKNFKTFIAILAISIASVVPASANNTDPIPATTEAKTLLRSEIVNLLGSHKYDLEHKTLEAQVAVMLNNDNELIVVSVRSEDKTVSSFVKAKLNYKKVEVKGIQKGTVYRVPLKMKQSS